MGKKTWHTGKVWRTNHWATTPILATSGGVYQAQWMLSTSGNKIFVFKSFWSGNKKQFSFFKKWLCGLSRWRLDCDPTKMWNDLDPRNCLAHSHWCGWGECQAPSVLPGPVHGIPGNQAKRMPRWDDWFQVNSSDWWERQKVYGTLHGVCKIHGTT